MIIARRWQRRLRTFVGSLSRRNRSVIALLACLLVAGTVLLFCQPSEPKLVPILSEKLDDRNIAVALAVLEQKGIATVVSTGRLMVGPAQVDRARSILASEGLPASNISDILENPSRQSDPWSTSDQNDKRWQTAKMTALSRLVETFQQVRSAVVIYEPGAPRRFGNANVEPTASVKVVLKPSATMDRKLVVAIADLITGSVSGMNRRNVRIIDNSGQSYHVSDEGMDAPEDRLEQIRLAEAYHREKIQSALRYIQNVIIGVHVEGDGANGKCLGASVSVPRSYLLSLVKAASSITTAPSDQLSQLQTDQQLARIQQTVMSVIGSNDPASVKVDWYMDSLSDTPAAVGVANESIPANVGWFGRYWHVFTGATLVIIIACLGGIFWSRHRRAGGATDNSADLADDTARTTTAFAFLQNVSRQDISESLRQEHPQTIALVLAHLPPEKSASVLDGLESETQVEVMRRIAAMETIDPDVVAEVEASVAQRLGAIAPVGDITPGLERVSQILHHAVARTEQTVMKGLRDQEPALADSISQKMFRFEDIMHIPTVRLKPVLERFNAEELAIALRTANQQMQKRVLSCLSSASSQLLREEMERLGPVKLSDVETAQQHVAEAVRRLSDGQYISQQSIVDSELLA